MEDFANQHACIIFVPWRKSQWEISIFAQKDSMFSPHSLMEPLSRSPVTSCGGSPLSILQKYIENQDSSQYLMRLISPRCTTGFYTAVGKVKMQSCRQQQEPAEANRLPAINHGRNLTPSGRGRRSTPKTAKTTIPQLSTS